MSDGLSRLSEVGGVSGLREFLLVSWREAEETGRGLEYLGGKGRVFLPEGMARSTEACRTLQRAAVLAL